MELALYPTKNCCHGNLLLRVPCAALLLLLLLARLQARC
jgi:hypothetical protein